MKRRHESHEGGERERQRAGSTPLMALALFAGVVAGARLAESWYREQQTRRLQDERRDRIERWEDEGGALPGTVGTGGAANPRPGA
ncbi:MAG TPA: hypothetical protein VGE10_09460 [Zeimonas sp.]